MYKQLLLITAKPDYVEGWFVLQIKALYISSHLSHWQSNGPKAKKEVIWSENIVGVSSVITTRERLMRQCYAHSADSQVREWYYWYKHRYFHRNTSLTNDITPALGNPAECAWHRLVNCSLVMIIPYFCLNGKRAALKNKTCIVH